MLKFDMLLYYGSRADCEKLLPVKFKTADSAKIFNHWIAITWPQIVQFRWNLTQGLAT